MWRMKTSEVHLLEITASLFEAAAADLQDPTKKTVGLLEYLSGM